MSYKTLFSTLKIGLVVLPNRLVMPAITTNLAANDGVVTDGLIDFYSARAAGGVGMVRSSTP